MNECVLCGWVYDPYAAPWAVYLPGQRVPVTWKDSHLQPEPVLLTDLMADTVPGCALVHHWSQAHREQLRGLIGDFEVDHWPRDG